MSSQGSGGIARLTLVFRSLACLGVVSMLVACTPKVVTSALPARPVTARIAFTSATQPSTIVIAHDGSKRRAFIADEYAKAVTIVPLGDEEANVQTIALEGTPARIAVGKYVYATLRDRSRVVAYELLEDGTARTIAQARTSGSASGLALTPDGATLVVTSSRGLHAFDADTLKPLFFVPMAREPRAVVLAPDGARAFVLDATSAVVVVVLSSHTITSHDVSLDVREQYRTVSCDPSCLGVLSPGWQAPDRYFRRRRAASATELASLGDDLIIPYTLDLPDVPDDPDPPGNDASTRAMQVPSIARVSMSTESLLTTTTADFPCSNTDTTPHCTQPVGVATAGNAVYVACAGIDTLIEYRADGEYDRWPECYEARQQQRRFAAGRGVRGIAIDPSDHHAFVWSRFDRLVTELDLDSSAASARDLVPPVKRYRISTTPAVSAALTAPSVCAPSEANHT